MKLFSKHVVKARVEEKQIGYFSKWYHCVVRELIVIRNYQDNWLKLAGDIRPKITLAQTRKSVELLLRLGLIEKNSDGTYFQTSKNVTTGDNPVDIMVVRGYHKEALENAKNAIDAFPKDERTCSSLVMSVTKETYDKSEEEIN